MSFGLQWLEVLCNQFSPRTCELPEVMSVNFKLVYYVQVSGYLGFSGSSARVARSVPVSGCSISLVPEEVKTEKST